MHVLQPNPPFLKDEESTMHHTRTVAIASLAILLIAAPLIMAPAAKAAAKVTITTTITDASDPVIVGTTATMTLDLDPASYSYTIRTATGTFRGRLFSLAGGGDDWEVAGPGITACYYNNVGHFTLTMGPTYIVGSWAD